MPTCAWALNEGSGTQMREPPPAGPVHPKPERSELSLPFTRRVCLTVEFSPYYVNIFPTLYESNA